MEEGGKWWGTDVEWRKSHGVGAIEVVLGYEGEGDHKAGEFQGS